MKTSCTIIIPTKNRFKHLISLLGEYVRVKYSGTIFVCDSSDFSKEEELKNIFKNSPFKLQYYYDIGWPWQVIKKILPNINSDYAIFSGDDDYIIVDSLIKMIIFLDDPENTEYQGVTGHSYLLFGNENTKFDNIVVYNVIRKNEDSAFDRVDSLLSNYNVPLFSLIRKKTFIRAVESVDLDSSKWLPSTQFINDEILISCMFVACGKIAFLNHNFIIRNIHPERNILSNEHTPLEFYNYAIDYFVSKLDDAILENDLDFNVKKNVTIRKSFVRYFNNLREERINDESILTSPNADYRTFKQRFRLILTRLKYFMFIYILFRVKKLNTSNSYSLANTCYKIYLGLPAYK